MRKLVEPSPLRLVESLEWASKALAIHAFNLPPLAGLSAPADLNISVDRNESPQAGFKSFQ
jgi:hypothetical protein